MDRARDALLTDFGKATLEDRYLLPNESYQDMFAREPLSFLRTSEVGRRLRAPREKLRRSLVGLGEHAKLGVARDNLERTGTVPALAAGFIEIELDVETGRYEILDYLGVADCGTVMHPQGLDAQIKSGAVMGFGLAALERHI